MPLPWSGWRNPGKEIPDFLDFNFLSSFGRNFSSSILTLNDLICSGSYLVKSRLFLKASSA